MKQSRSISSGFVFFATIGNRYGVRPNPFDFCDHGRYFRIASIPKSGWVRARTDEVPNTIPSQGERQAVEIFFILVVQLFSYGILAWILFVAIVFATARLSPWYCIPIAHMAVTIIVGALDLIWIESEMSKPGWDGTPDRDAIFIVGVMIRVFLINAFLLPFTAAGVGMRYLDRMTAENNESDIAAVSVGDC